MAKLVKKNQATILMVLAMVSAILCVEPCMADDFASEVVSYVYVKGDGSGAFIKSASALGRPTVDTKGDGSYFPNMSLLQSMPVVPVYAAFRTSEIVTVGVGGQLVLKFDHPVLNDPHNPYGIDFLVFGNAFQVTTSDSAWINGDPALVVAGVTEAGESGRVSVSQDGQTWYTFSSGPYADSFAPTLGRCYDTVNPDSSLNTANWTNEWWGSPTDPTLPLPPGLSFAKFQGKTVAEIVQVYDKSAGGTGFDLSTVGLDWIQYVRIQDAGKGTPEIDAIADVAPRKSGDANLDGMVDVGDLGILAANYGSTLASWCKGDFTGDGCVDVGDLGVLAANYGSSNFSTDSAKAFGATVTENNSDNVEALTSNETCSILGLPVIVGFFFAGLMLMKLGD
jgi:hypothetical protein